VVNAGAGGAVVGFGGANGGVSHAAADAWHARRSVYERCVWAQHVEPALTALTPIQVLQLLLP
jgi:hypothetical protein